MTKKYQIIYADPPWRYNDRRNTHTRFCGGAMAHYSVMDYKDIAKLPIPQLSAESAVLFCWATFPMLKEALYVIEQWGFKYKTLGFSWIKTNKKNGKPFFGIGYYAKSNCEVCLMAVKGKIIKPASNKVSSVIIAPRREHSRKPDEAIERIVELFGDLPRIELFAREKTPGWDVWGNEVDSDIQLADNPPVKIAPQIRVLDKHRQSIINAAVAALREKRK